MEARARAVLAPYSFDIREVAWCSAYEIGQRLCDRFDDGDKSVVDAMEQFAGLAAEGPGAHKDDEDQDDEPDRGDPTEEDQ